MVKSGHVQAHTTGSQLYLLWTTGFGKSLNVNEEPIKKKPDKDQFFLK